MRNKGDRDALTGRLFGLSGLELGMELCSTLLNTVGRDGFHGGVRPDNITIGGQKPELGPPLAHKAGEFTPQELEFMSPELFWSGQRTPAADVYSVGLTMYAIYNGGRLPFWSDKEEADASGRTSALQKRMRGEDMPSPPGASRELCAVIMRALAFRAEERWRDPEEFRNALGDCSLSDNTAKEAAVAAAAISSLAGSPLDRSGHELSEIEHMMAEIIEQGKPAIFHIPEDTPAPEPVPAPETVPALETVPAPETVPVSEGPAGENPTPAPPSPGKPEPASVPAPEPVTAAEPEGVSVPITAPVHTTAQEEKQTPPKSAPAAASISESASSGTGAPRLRKGRLGIVIAAVCVAAALLLYFLLRSCGPLTPAPTPTETVPTASPAGNEASVTSTAPSPTAQSSPSSEPTSVPTPAEGTALPVMVYTPEPSPSPTPESSATPSPAAEKYRVIAEDCTWEEAQQRCEELGGHLAVARNQGEFDELTSAAEKAGVYMLWLGAQRQADDTWLWVTGETAEYFVWDAGQPSNKDLDGTAEDCLLLWKVNFGSGAWAFNDCRSDPVAAAPRYYSGKLGYICEFD